MLNSISDTKLNALLKQNLKLETQLSTLSKEFIETDSPEYERQLEFQVAEFLAKLMNTRKQIMQQMQKDNVDSAEISRLYNNIQNTEQAPVFFLGSLDGDGHYADLRYSKWYNRTRTGSIVSQFNTGMLYLMGLGGIKPDLIEAHTWLDRAGRQKYCCSDGELRVFELVQYQLGHFQFIGTLAGEVLNASSFSKIKGLG